MFDKPKTGTAYVAPAEPIDVNQRYMLKVEELIDLGVSRFPGPDLEHPIHRIQWKFVMADMNGNKILDIDGNPYRHFDYTNSTTSKSDKPGGKTATARLWMEAFFGKALEDDEIGPNIANDLRGKVAVALLEAKDAESQGGEAYTQLSILRLSPRRANAAEQAVEKVNAAAANAQTTVARARTAVATPPAESDDDSLPF